MVIWRRAWFLLALVLPVTLAAASVTATLERNPIHLDETVRLVLSVASKWTSVQPDLSVLNREFEVLGTSTNTQVQLINGQQSASTRWLVELAPRRSGNIRINPIRIGQQRTNGLVLTVLPAKSQSSSAGGRDIYLEAEITPQNPYVQSQLTYTLRLFRAVEILDGSLSEPSVEDATIVRLGKDSSYTKTNAGRDYRVIERRYAIFPQSSGELLIPPVFFNGQIAERGLGGSTFSRLFTRGKRIRRSTKLIRVTVREKPTAFSGSSWLPANQLHIKESWPDGGPRFRVGEPITRTLRIEARGLSGAQLPEFELHEDRELKRYPDQPTTKTVTDKLWVYGVQEQRIALLPTKEGDIELPEVRITWWDTEQDQQRVAIVPRRRFSVAPALSEMTAIATGAKPEPEPLRTDATRSGDGAIWQGISAALLIGWLLTFALARRSTATPRQPASDPAPNLLAARRSLQRACNRNDATAARAALLDWGANAWPARPPGGLLVLAERLSNRELARAVNELDSNLYASTQQAWQGGKIIKNLRDLTPHAPRPTKTEQDLPELYQR